MFNEANESDELGGSLLGLGGLWQKGIVTPLVTFIEQSVFTAERLSLCEDRHQQWSVLAPADESVPEHARLTVFPAGYS